jgi:RNA polymerase sigma-70 factor (ECF subfamily)
MKNLENATDEQLIKDLKSEKQEALTELYKRHGSTMKAVILRIVHDETEADDLLVEAFMEIWRHAKDYSPTKGKPFAWMITIVRRRAIDRLRKREAYSRAKDRYHNEVQGVFTASRQKSAIKEIVISDMRKFLNKILDYLPVAQKETLKLVFFQGLSQRQVAVLTHTPLGTVKTRLELGMDKMAAAMADSKAKIW